MPRGIPKNPKIKKHYYLVSGEVEYVETKDALPKTVKVNCVHIDMSTKLNIKSLAQIQTLLQMHFHTKYSMTHKTPPEAITDAIIGSVSYLGVFTNDEFHKDAPEEEITEEKKEEKAKEPELKIVKEEPKPMGTPDAVVAETPMEHKTVSEPVAVAPATPVVEAAPVVVVAVEPMKPLVEVPADAVAATPVVVVPETPAQ
jgi:hypothetical protein